MTDGFDDLTEKQRVYVEQRLAGMSKAAAYRAAYDAENMKPESVFVAAWKVENNGKVRQRLAALRAQRIEEADLTRHEHVARLEALQERALAEGDLKAALRAEELIGRATGLYVEKHQQVESDDPAVLEAELNKLRAERGADPAETRH